MERGKIEGINEGKILRKYLKIKAVENGDEELLERLYHGGFVELRFNFKEAQYFALTTESGKIWMKHVQRF